MAIKYVSTLVRSGSKDTTDKVAMSDWVKVAEAPSYSGKTGFDDSGLDLKASIKAFKASAELKKSLLKKVEVTEAKKLNFKAGVLKLELRNNESFSDCWNIVTEHPSSRIIGGGLAIAAGEFEFIGDGNAGIEVSEAEINKIVSAGGGAKIDYKNNGKFSFAGDADKPETLIVVAYRDIPKIDGGFTLSGGAGPEDNDVMAYSEGKRE